MLSIYIDSYIKSNAIYSLISHSSSIKVMLASGVGQFPNFYRVPKYHFQQAQQEPPDSHLLTEIQEIKFQNRTLAKPSQLSKSQGKPLGLAPNHPAFPQTSSPHKTPTQVRPVYFVLYINLSLGDILSIVYIISLS